MALDIGQLSPGPHVSRYNSYQLQLDTPEATFVEIRRYRS